MVTDSWEWQLYVADGAATGAVLALTGSIGLVEIIDQFRFSAEGETVPAPGAYDIPKRIRDEVAIAMDAASSCRVLGDELTVELAERTSGSTADEARALRLRTQIEDASAQAQEAALRARYHLRHLCQLALGVAQHIEHRDTEVLERAAAGVLFHDDTATPATTDRIALAGKTGTEVSVELAGLLSRMLHDRHSGSDASPQFVVAGPAGEVRVLVTEPGGIDLPGVQTFPPPVVVTEATARIVRELGPVLADAVLRWPPAPPS
jgi:hypothetical protein